MECKYTATVYTNNHIINCLDGNDLRSLITSLLLNLGDCLSGSHGTITDNSQGVIVQRYRKSVID